MMLPGSGGSPVVVVAVVVVTIHHFPPARRATHNGPLLPQLHLDFLERPAGGLQAVALVDRVVPLLFVRHGERLPFRRVAEHGQPFARAFVRHVLHALGTQPLLLRILQQRIAGEQFSFHQNSVLQAIVVVVVVAVGRQRRHAAHWRGHGI